MEGVGGWIGIKSTDGMFESIECWIWLSNGSKQQSAASSMEHGESEAVNMKQHGAARNCSNGCYGAHTVWLDWCMKSEFSVMWDAEQSGLLSFRSFFIYNFSLWWGKEDLIHFPEYERREKRTEIKCVFVCTFPSNFGSNCLTII